VGREELVRTEGAVDCLVNDRAVTASTPASTVALDFLRAHERLSGVKEGCREGDCGACTVLLGELRGDHVNYRAVCACLLPLGDAHGKHLVTVEGLTHAGGLSPVQRLLVDEGGVQCGFCTPGFVVSLTGYLLGADDPSGDAAVEAVGGNLCRCTGHVPIVRAARRLVESLDLPADGDRLRALVDLGAVPAYFLEVPARLAALGSGGDGPEQVPEVDPDRPLVAGGTDAYVGGAFSLPGQRVQRIADWQRGARVSEDATALWIPATATIEDLRESPIVRRHLPELVAALELFGSAPIRHRATVGGNLVTASPIGDLTCLLMALDATVVLRDGPSQRTLPLRSLYTGYKQLAKRPSELVESVVVRKPGPHTRVSYEKVSRRRHLDIASVNSTMVAEVQGDALSGVSISAGGVGPTMLLLRAAAAALEGRRLDEGAVAAALQAAQTEIAPISDVRGSAAYKRLLLRQLIAAHLDRLVPGVVTASVLP
jgi:xanthine dehydrogenase small subunit